jgi:hypothetical protein
VVSGSGIVGAVHLELGDETFIAAERRLVAAVVGDPGRWPLWWPDLSLEVLRDRGDKGRQWRLTGTIGGTAEIYLEPWHDGTVVHLFLRLEVPDGTRAAPGRGSRAVPDRRSRAVPGRGSRVVPGRAEDEWRRAWKRTIHQVKDELEAGRRPGAGARTTAQVEPRT